MKKQKNKPGVADIEAKDNKVMWERPSDGLLEFVLTPETLNQSVFFDADRFAVYDRSQIDPRFMSICSDLFAENGSNNIRLVSFSWSDEETGADATQQEIEASSRFSLLVELKMGEQFINAEFGPYPARYSRMLDEGFRFRANNAFVRAAALIGISASIGIVFDEKAA